MSSNKNPYFLPIGNSGMMKRWIVDNVDIPSIKHCHTAGVSMNPGTAVYAASDGKVYPYQIGFDSLYIGVLEDPAYVGKPVTVQYGGYLKVEGAGWQPGVVYYATNGGLLSASGSGRQVAVGTGTDEIVLTPDASGELEDDRGVYFVDKRYDGIAGASVAGYTIASITSSNTSYTYQLSVAKRGSVNNPYPDPWSARNKALEDITSGFITEATIIVLGGEWTLGHVDPAKNGSADGANPNSGVVADICFTDAQGGTNNTFNTSSLIKNKLNYFFHPGTGIINIASNAMIMLVSDRRPTSSTAVIYSATLKGHLDYTVCYGGSNTFNMMFSQAGGDLVMEFNNITTLSAQSTSILFYLYSFVNCTIKINTLKRNGGGECFWVYCDNVYSFPNNHKSVLGGASSLVIDVKNLISIPDTTNNTTTVETSLLWFYGTSFGQRYEGTYNGSLSVENVYIKGIVNERFRNLAHFDGLLPFNLNFDVNLKNVTVVADDNAWVNIPPNTAECSLFTVTASAHKALININCSNLLTEYPLLRTCRMNTQDSTGAYANTGNYKVNLHCGNCVKQSNAYLSGTQLPTMWLALMYDNGSSTDTTASQGILNVSGTYTGEYWLVQFAGGSSNSYKARFSGYYETVQIYSTFFLDTDKTDFLSITDAILNSGSFSYAILPGTTYPSKIYNVFLKNVMSKTTIEPLRVVQVGETATVNSSIGTFLT